MSYTGSFSILNGPTYNYIAYGQSAFLSLNGHGSLQGYGELNSNNRSVTLYSSTGIGDYTAEASISIDSTTNVITLSYNVTWSNEIGTSQVSGNLCSWTPS